MNPQSLRFKLSWTNGLAISLFVLVIGYARYKTVSYRALSGFDEDLLIDSNLVLNRLRSGGNGFTLDTEGLAPTDAITLEEMRPYILISSEGKVLQTYFKSRYNEGLLTSRELNAVLAQNSGFGNAVAADGTSFRFVSLVFHSKEYPKGVVVHLGRSMESLNGVLNEYLYVHLFSVPLILAISVPVGWFLAGRALRPFAEMARVAEQITSRNLNTQMASGHSEEEIQRLEQSFNAMVKRLNESFQQMRKFNADVAHELRTPLSIMQGENEIGLRCPYLPDEIHAVLVSNLEELARLSRMVKDMLMLAEAEAGSRVLSLAPTRLRPLIVDLVDQARALALDRGTEIDLLEAADVAVEADSLWLRRALLNLIDNAIKYSKENGRIEIWVRAKENLVCLGVQDNGIGISQKDLPHIFDRLYRADPARTRAEGGVGLGLTVVKWIVEAHKGQIRVQSELDRGSCFEILLPALATHFTA